MKMEITIELIIFVFLFIWLLLNTNQILRLQKNNNKIIERLYSNEDWFKKT